MRLNFLLAFLVSAGLVQVALAYDPKEVLVTGHELPAELKNLGVKENLGETIDLSLPFVADTGEAVTLGTYFKKDRPVLMAMVYYTCPSLCNYHLNALTEAMKNLKWTAGQEFELIAVSMNHRETPEVAAKKKNNYIKEYGRPQAINGWHFLTGTEQNVKALADQLGFSFRWMPNEEQYAHASVAYVVTGGGRLSRYIHGLNVDEKTLRLSLLEASSGKIGSIIDQAVMFCFVFDPKKNKYTLYAWNLMRIGGVFALFLLGIFMIPLWRRERLK